MNSNPIFRVPDLTGVATADLSAQLDELDRLTTQGSGTMRELRRLEEEHVDVERADQAAFAAALRAGKAEPPSQAAKVRARMEELKRRNAALRLAVRQSQDAIVRSLVTNRAAWTARADEARATALQQAVEGLSHYLRARRRLAQVDQARQWIVGFPDVRDRPTMSMVSRLSMPFEQVATALQDELEPRAATDESPEEVA